LAALLDFQQQVAMALERAVALAGPTAAAVGEAAKTPKPGTPNAVAAALTELAIDLEHADAPPTVPQRELLSFHTARLDQLEASR
jgi:hypothetical protein